MFGAMKCLFVLVFCLPSFAADSCVILRNYPRRTADAFTRWTTPPSFEYVEGNFPAGFKFRSEIRDKHVREIQKRGGRVVIIKADYQQAELDDARKQCKEKP